MHIHNTIWQYDDLHQLRNYPYLKALNITRTLSDHGYPNGYDIEILLSRYSAGSTKDLQLVFIGAVDIHIGGLAGLFGLFVTIEDVADRQLEDMKFRVVEQEEGVFCFYCKAFTASLVEPT
ncbi:hypothetical protein KFZ76_20885 [Methylovulum psychrotolerans]|uniref:hypothetical protein n=1 Tax=Methylovulum psychrotolerans TaxID=1704499 RepID=UPI001BFF3F82|nr:hypothetical protein [Methylovulum psychrotolerans]MBT9100163.1 hypothetical protein [Methylovulum psychrotolerans]